MAYIGEKINAIIDDAENNELIQQTAAEIKELCANFPAPGLEHIS
jgi:glycine hydroxymethyltransferase